MLNGGVSKGARSGTGFAGRERQQLKSDEKGREFFSRINNRWSLVALTASIKWEQAALVLCCVCRAHTGTLSALASCTVGDVPVVHSPMRAPRGTWNLPSASAGPVPGTLSHLRAGSGRKVPGTLPRAAPGELQSRLSRETHERNGGRQEPVPIDSNAYRNVSRLEPLADG